MNITNYWPYRIDVIKLMDIREIISNNLYIYMGKRLYLISRKFTHISQSPGKCHDDLQIINDKCNIEYVIVVSGRHRL